MKFVIILLLASFFVLPALADPPPLPERKKLTLEQINKQLESEKNRRSNLESSRAKTEADLKDLQSRLVKAGQSIKDKEYLLHKLESRITALGAEKEELESNLENDYAHFADLVLALSRLQRVPPEALLARPGAPLETAQTALLLESILPAVYGRAATLAEDLSRLGKIERELQTDQQTERIALATLATEQEKLETLADERRSLMEKLDRDYRVSGLRVQQLADEARNLADLMRRLEKERRAQELAQRTANASRQKPSAAPVPSMGNIQWPVGGRVVIAYGETDMIGARSEGVRLEARAKALVVAPMGGIVRFAGPFKNYGGMVILEHKDGYHSLLGGIQDITVGLNQSVRAGEPIGKLPSASSRGGLPALYYELRHKGRSVNPAEKLARS